MEDRYKFRCGISTTYRNEEDEEKEISLVVEPADVFLSQSSVSIWRDDLRELLEEKLAGTEHEEYLENIMDRFEEDDQNSLDGDYLVIDCDWFDQCTGLKDKNGKLIYEGDILRVRHRASFNRPFYVLWRESCADFVAGNRYGCILFDPCSGIWAEHNCEIIGNIHENPELLKGGVE